MPAFTFLFGDIVVNFTSFTDPSHSIVDAINPLCVRLLMIGGIMFVASYFYYVFLVILAERIAKKTRVAYLRSILGQEIGWFESSINITELSARLSKETQAIQNALGEKMGQLQLTFAMSFAGFFFAFFRGWWMSLILLFAFPVMFIMTGILMKAMKSGFTENLKAYGQSAGYAEQALNAIRVV
jgi:ATP-binding cassette subfamily B (MDR/TAP) protein 1